MGQRVLIIGGGGRIGRSVASDLLRHTDVTITLTGRRSQAAFKLQPRQRYQALSLDDLDGVRAAIAQHNLVIHCAGPFRTRDFNILAQCIEQRTPYIDVADSPDYVREALAFGAVAKAAGVTCIVSTGVFPGISNSMVRQGIEQLAQADRVHLSYLVAGSGGAGVTVMRTTFVELQTPFEAKVNGQRIFIQPYCDREVLPFPEPYNKGAGVYWFNTVEALTLPQSFPQLDSVITKFGSLPDIYNHLTSWMTLLPAGWLKTSAAIEFLSQVSYAMTQVTDRFSGTGIAMRLAIQGQHQGQSATYLATLTHPDTAEAAGYGTGSIAQLLLSGQLSLPGVWPVEQALPTSLFEQTLAARNLEIARTVCSGD
ncbi:saccharopine dehydrogenase NADP-binding domain-containing protein [Leptolyngbya cf. ectocarpi LEGE 11479]|uniref:Saccharopine dehydrogenase NADP-binding domain-containing protein n=1 Tax=Leptolyngbya cf. ectocarpi LEGE 11479 TaxID=1828722 RepID=A0A929F8A2_LEPEC|nr:saccharopine dehydrogenase NADP-binding domain-containing protein [Leptolyngbya ectocarpi]MBE9068706.1 saccharopine dehydrogenase NADP-binding domain-containing protein [Leptolyngbya cf. ectocarpi LEGE 11479]